MALFFCLFWLFLLIPPDFGFARIGETDQMQLGIRSDGKGSSVRQKEESKNATATAPHVAPTPPTSPMRLPETQSVVFFWKTDQGSVESRVAKIKGDGDVIEIMSENRKLPILGSQLVLVIAPLPLVTTYENSQKSGWIWPPAVTTEQRRWMNLKHSWPMAGQNGMRPKPHRKLPCLPLTNAIPTKSSM